MIDFSFSVSHGFCWIDEAAGEKFRFHPFHKNVLFFWTIPQTSDIMIEIFFRKGASI